MCGREECQHPHQELQPLVDYLEGANDPFGDFAQGDDFDYTDIWDGRMNLDLEED